MNTHLLIRKSHRYLGLLIGIQFLGWTLSGLYFSWNNLDDVHGDHMRKSPRTISVHAILASPQTVVAALQKNSRIDSIQSIQLISLVGKPLYQIAYFSGQGEHHHQVSYALADAATGTLRGPLSEDEATALARDYVVPSAKITGVSHIGAADAHHEYRGRPLPAYAVMFKDPDCTIYISPDRGNFQTIRHDQWRMFDFLWMFHTMDYEGRDNFNNWLLRIFSVMGLITVLSGFVLFFVSSPVFRRRSR